MKILELEIPTNNLEQTKRFYTDVLELKVAESTANSVTFLAGYSRLRFTESDNKNRNYHFAFNIPCNKIDEALKWLSTKCEVIKNSAGELITVFKNWNAHSIYFYDASNNILEFIARHDLENTSDQYFGRKDILSISEVGIVDDKPLDLAENLIEEEGLSYFARGPKREDFVALGDDNGLIVISGSERNWYPTDHPAERDELKMKLEVNNATREITIST
ncbi:VOC family protein [Draconibacterium sp. IB214405]|uniref:VOC family protein n=1 Tax=Draconibacterium sp. IB214405 TaxID=3097352 RepID=UPI002A179AA3|nr:VOC family protein [Draconibacterium sp. IB214405]MDX8341120.1 VOC family protein [Draconibacterium sp. IB214405]